MNSILWIEHGHWKIRNGMLVYMFSIYAIFPWWYQGILFLLTLSPSIRNLNYNTFTEEKLYTIIVLSDYFIPWRPSSCALEKTSDAIDFYIKLNISVNLFLKKIYSWSSLSCMTFYARNVYILSTTRSASYK